MQHTLTNTANAAIWCTFVFESFLENWILSKFVESLKLDPVDQCRGRLIHPEFWRLRCTGYVVPLQCSFLLLATSNWFDLVCLWILRKLKPNGWPQRMHPRGGVFHGNPPRKPSTLIHSAWTFSRISFGNASSLSCLWLSRCPVAKSWRCSNISGSVFQLAESFFRAKLSPCRSSASVRGKHTPFKVQCQFLCHQGCQFNAQLNYGKEYICDVRKEPTTPSVQGVTPVRLRHLNVSMNMRTTAAALCNLKSKFMRIPS